MAIQESQEITTITLTPADKRYYIDENTVEITDVSQTGYWTVTSIDQIAETEKTTNGVVVRVIDVDKNTHKVTLEYVGIEDGADGRYTRKHPSFKFNLETKGGIGLQRIGVHFRLKLEDDNPLPIPPMKGDIKESFFPNKAYNCKKSLPDVYIRRMGSNERGANFNIGSLHGNKMNDITGWEHLWSAEEPNGDYMGGFSGGKGRCLQIATNNIMADTQGVMLGEPKAPYLGGYQCRWTNATGIQFSWSTQNTWRDNAKGLRLERCFMIYKEQNDGVARFAIIVDKNQVYKDMNGKDIYGNDTDPTEAFYETTGDNIMSSYNRRDRSGTVKMALNANDTRHVFANNSVLIAIMLTFKNPRQGANYYNVMDFWNFRLLWPEPDGIGLNWESRSRLVLPAPHKIEDFDSGRFPLI